MKIRLMVGHSGSYYREDFDEYVFDNPIDFKNKIDDIFSNGLVEELEILNDCLLVYVGDNYEQ